MENHVFQTSISNLPRLVRVKVTWVKVKVRVWVRVRGKELGLGVRS